MANIIIGYHNRVDAATLSGGAWSATLPQINLQNRIISKVARTTTDAIASATINVDLGAAYPIGAVALIAHNISTSGLVRIRGDDANDFATPLYNSGWIEVWTNGIIPEALLEWEDDNFWLGTLSAEVRAGYRVPYINLDSAKTTARYWRIEVDDTSNVDTYIQIGRLFMSDFWQPTRNYNYGAQMQFDDPTSMAVSVGGQEYFDARSRYRIHRLRLEFVSETDAYAEALELQRIVGTSGEVLIVPDSADTTNGALRNFVGRLRSLSPITISPTNLFALDLEVKELL